MQYEDVSWTSAQFSTFTQVRMPRLSYSVILLEHAATPWSALWFIAGRVSIFRVLVE